MLPILKAQGFEKILTGGSTRPWLIVVFIEHQPFPYVVKLYNKKDIDQSHSVAKDVYSSILATNFGLNTPKPALIEFTESFIKSLSHDIKEELSKKDVRLKFGCEFIDGSFAYIDTLHRESLRKYDFENIYMFDNLIKNTDRKPKKSNILLKGTAAYLIDHELTFPINEHTISEFNDNKIVYWKENHIFYNYLKNSHINDKKEYFKDFSKKLSETDFNILDSYAKQMISYKHDNEHNFSIIKNYLCLLKQNSDKFANLVRSYI
ncbi:MAG TPA: HipA family kinase [Bacteroidia bacterium]